MCCMNGFWCNVWGDESFNCFSIGVKWNFIVAWTTAVQRMVLYCYFSRVEVESERKSLRGQRANWNFILQLISDFQLGTIYNLVIFCNWAFWLVKEVANSVILWLKNLTSKEKKLINITEKCVGSSFFVWIQTDFLSAFPCPIGVVPLKMFSGNQLQYRLHKYIS